MSDNFEVLGLESDGPDMVATVRITHTVRMSSEACRHLGVFLVRRTDPAPSLPPPDDDPV
jgi:hypothetical protein